MSDICFEVPGRSRREIFGIAANVRASLKMHDPFFPILHVVEFLMPAAFDGFHFTVGEHADMGDNHGMTYPETNEIRLREDVYEGVRQNRGRDRFTLAHELGHYLMHSSPGLARVPRAAAEVPTYRSSEWQANAFAGSLLVPRAVAEHFRGSCFDIADACKVTPDCAIAQVGQYRKEGMRQPRND